MVEWSSKVGSDAADFRGLFEAMPDALFVVGDDRRFVDANPAASELLGVARERVVGTRLEDYVESSRTRDVQDKWARALREGSHDDEHVLKRPDGQLRIVELRVRVRAVRGLHLAVVRDVTARRSSDGFLKEQTDKLSAESDFHRNEVQLRDAQKLEALGRVAAGVAHDMNNVLSIVVSCSELALSRRSQTLDPFLLENLASIRAAGERGANVTRQLLAFCRRQSLSPRPTDLGKTVSVMQPLLRRLLPEAIRLHVKTHADMPIVRLDAAQLERVTVNLVTNARDAMPNGGDIEISVNCIVVDGPTTDLPKITAGQYIELVVKDTGKGLSDEARARLFEPFFTTKEPGCGGGLGLAVVFGIVTQSKGHIRIHSVPGLGTEITLLFPVDDVLELPVESSPDSKLMKGNETILLTEDDDAVRQIAARVLRGLGYEVLEAKDGESALAQLESVSARVRLLMSDVVMPGMDGCALAEKVRARWPHVGIVLMSGYNELVSTFADTESPGYLFLQKPFTPALLASKAREALESEVTHA
jgi:two-component system, cell cycle sensor histidine kinase and response regulator CckA